MIIAADIKFTQGNELQRRLSLDNRTLHLVSWSEFSSYGAGDFGTQAEDIETLTHLASARIGAR